MGLKAAYLLRNLLRNPLRTLLTCAAVGLPIMIFVLSVAAVDGIERFLNNSAKQLRLAVTHKAGVVNNLPFGHRAKIEGLDPERKHILGVCAVLWIGGKIPNDSRQLSSLGADADTFVDMFPEYHLTAEQIEHWRRDKMAIIVGPGTARQFNWQDGDRLTIRPSVPPYEPIEFRAIVPTGDVPDPTTNWFRRDYWEDRIAGTSAVPGWINFFFVRCASMADIDKYRVEIDRIFARTPDETNTLDEKTFMNQFISQQFDLPRNLTILSMVTVFVAIMAAANTMSMNFRDRIGEYATLKSMGFGRRTIFGLVQSEAMVLCGAGGVLGAALPYVLFTFTPLRNFTVPLIQTLIIRESVCVAGVGIAMLIGVIASIWPSILAFRLHVVAALRNLE
ncbi:MAG: ABC transporter permease [Planctomycetes bacterium]|nr:ABC transporter permease [Planctomycetota bacterium]